MTKAYYTYMGYVSTPTTLDWIVGVTWAIMHVPCLDCSPWPELDEFIRSYWVGMLEDESPSIVPWLFEKDLYQNGVLDILVGFLSVFVLSVTTVIVTSGTFKFLSDLNNADEPTPCSWNNIPRQQVHRQSSNFFVTLANSMLCLA